jgi:GDPmannose 4,6-dehydratase
LKKALVIGYDGQDGTWLVPYLERRGYSVAGIGRGSSVGLASGVDIVDRSQVLDLIASFVPNEIYYLAAVHYSSEPRPPDDPELFRRSFEINTIALSNFLHAIAAASPRSRLFYAASSRVFGNPGNTMQDEDTPLNPVDCYGISKTAGVHVCRYYRKQRNVFCSAGILYNHESPRRPAAFVSRKIVRAAVRISRGMEDRLLIGDLDAMVDWGYAPDYIDAAWRILQLDEPDDFVIASGALHSVREFVETAFEGVGLDWTAHVQVDPNALAARRDGMLRGDCGRLAARTGWHPATPFREMVLEMLQAELENETIC